MNKILELREKRAKAWEAAKAFLDSKRGANGLLSAEDVAAYDKMEADVVNLGKEIDRLERQARRAHRRGKDGPRLCGIPEILLERHAEQNARPRDFERPAGGYGFRGRLPCAG